MSAMQECTNTTSILKCDTITVRNHSVPVLALVHGELGELRKYSLNHFGSGSDNG